MDILVPIDGSDCSFRALTFAAGMVKHYEGTLHAVHITDEETEATDDIMDRARDVLEAESVEDEPEASTDVELEFRPGERIGRDIVDLVEERGYDHVVMGHHGAGTVERAILGSAAQTVVDARRIPVTIIP